MQILKLILKMILVLVSDNYYPVTTMLIQKKLTVQGVQYIIC